MISVAIVQDFQPTFTQGENFGVTLTRLYSESFGYAWTPFIDTTLRATYSENDVTGVGNTTGNTNTFSGQASLTWRLRRWLTLGLDYTYNRYNQGLASGGVATENRAAIRVNASF